MRTQSSRPISLLRNSLAFALLLTSIGCVNGGLPPSENPTGPVASVPEPSGPSLSEPVLVDSEPAPSVAPSRFPDWLVEPKGGPMHLVAMSSLEEKKANGDPQSKGDFSLAVQSGHPGDAYTVRFTPDGRHLATGGGERSDAAVRLWNLSTRKEIRYIPQPYGVEEIEFSPDGSKFRAIGGLFETETGKRLHGADSLEAYFAGRVARWFPSPDWKIVVAIEWNAEDSAGLLRVMRADSKETLVTFDVGKMRSQKIAFAKTAPRFAVRLATPGEDSTEIRIYDWSAQEQIAVLPAEGTRFTQLSPDGRRVLLAKEKKSCRMVDLDHPASNLWQLDSIAPASILLPTGAGFVGDDSQLLIGDSEGNSLLLIDSKSGEIVRRFVAPDPIEALALDTASGRLAGSFGTQFAGVESKSGEPHGIRIWDFSTGTVLDDLRNNSRHSYRSLDFSSDGRTLASAGIGLDPALWDLERGEFTRRLTGQVVEPNSARFHPSNRFLSVVGADSRMRVMDLATARTHATLEDCWETTWDPSGKWLGILPARKKRSSDGALLLWNLERAEVDQTLLSPKAEVTAFSFNSTGTRVAGVSWYKSQVMVWDTSKAETLWTGKMWNPSHVAFSPDGSVLASASMVSDDKRVGVVIWNAENGEHIANLDGGDVRYVDFSPDGHWLATAENSKSNGQVQVFDTRTWEKVGEFQGHDWIVTNVLFSSDSNQIISADMSGQILVRDRESGAITHDLGGHGFKINGLGLSPDGTQLASCSKDGKTILWDTEDFEELATLVIGRGENTVFTTPEGYYTMSPEAHHLVAFANGMNTYPFEQFDLRLNRPDLVARRLGRCSDVIADLYKRAWSKRVRRMGFESRDLTGGAAIPTLSILGTERLPLSQTDRSLTFRVRATDTSPLERLNLYVNDVPVWGSKGRDISQAATHEYEGEIKVRLGVGRNKIQVSCHNKAGFESLRSTFELTCTAPSTQPDAYILAVGVSQYQQDEYSLVYAAKDAEDITAAFEGNDLFSKVHSKLLTDSNATRDNILAAREFLARAGVDDQVILFVAGHGVLSNELDYYFGTYDIEFESPAERGLSYAALEGLVDGIASRKKLILMDTCYSGEVEAEGAELEEASVGVGVKARSSRGLRVRPVVATAGLGDLLGELFTDLRRGTGAVVVTSSSGTEYSYEDEKWANGVFSFAVLEGLRDRQAAGDGGAIRASELMEYVSRRVTQLTDGMQTPTMRRANLELDFPIWR